MIFKQPNGLYGRVSNIVNAPTHVDMTLEDVKVWLEKTNQLRPEESVEEWLNRYQGTVRQATDMTWVGNVTEEEIEEWKNQIGYKEGSK